MTQETLEEVAERLFAKEEQFIFKLGAKWQEQQTIEEVFEWLTTNNYLTDLKETLIENFKKR
jgi:SOS response regulatory protein OraA/RecX